MNMGGEFFIVTFRGWTSEEAVEDAVANAQHSYGNSGYTGTIAEKHTPRLIMHEPMEESEAEAHAKDGHLLDPEILDKWGNEVLCIPIADSEDDIGQSLFVFAGWVSR